MDIHFSSLPLEELTHLYQKADADLQRSLLNGDAWEKIKLKKQLVTELAKQIHKRVQPLRSDSATPADTAFRGDMPQA